MVDIQNNRSVRALQEKLQAFVYACRRGVPEGIPDDLVLSSEQLLAELQLGRNEGGLLPPQDDLYLLQIVGDVEPVLHGPFAHEESRLAEAKLIREDDGDLSDGLYRIKVAANSAISVDCFSGGELSD